MPIRYITVPATLKLKEPFTGEPLKSQDGQDEEFSFEAFLQKLMHNPVWGENFPNMKAQSEIMTAWEKCKASGESIIVLAEEDWLKLKAAAENPKFEVLTQMGSQIRAGYGVHPTLSRQLVPMVSAILDAPTTDPRVKAKA